MTIWRGLRRNRPAIAALGLLSVVAAVAVFAPLLAPHDENLATRFQDVFRGPSRDYLLGTDHVGRDILSRVLFGARYALLAGVEAVAIALAVGVPLGMLIGYRRGWLDAVVMRLVETLSSVPAIVMAMAIIAALGPGLATAMVAVGLVFAMIVTRLTRAEVLAAREELYVDGAVAVGAPHIRVMWRHILPNIAPTLIVQATLLFAQAILAEAALSFIGIGAGTGQASWGRMLRDAQIGLDRTIWPAIPPGCALFVTIAACNVVGDGLRDAFARGGRVGRLGGSRVARIGDPGPAAGADDDALLSVRGLNVRFPGREGDVAVVSGIDLDVGPGEVVALVGESGSGKSVTALSILGLVPDPGRAEASSLILAGRELAGAAPAALRGVRGNGVAAVFQEPMSALDPTMRVGRQVAEAMRVHGVPRRRARQRTLELLADVGIPDPAARSRAYPHEFSGGMAQRVMLAIALAGDPRLVIADEPTTALDVTVQGQILDLLGDLAARRGVGVLLITHDLGVVAELADRVAVMYAGQIVETGPLDTVLARPQHPYTAGLIAAVPRNRPRAGALETIPGAVPLPDDRPEHCRFAPRCPHAEPRCRSAAVEPHPTPGGFSRCVRIGELDLVGVSGASAREVVVS